MVLWLLVEAFQAFIEAFQVLIEAFQVLIEAFSGYDWSRVRFWLKPCQVLIEAFSGSDWSVFSHVWKEALSSVWNVDGTSNQAPTQMYAWRRRFACGKVLHDSSLNIQIVIVQSEKIRETFMYSINVPNGPDPNYLAPVFLSSGELIQGSPSEILVFGRSTMQLLLYDLL